MMINGKPDVIAASFDDVDMSDLRLPMLTVLYHPRDYREHIVVRVWDGVVGPTNTVLLFPDLEACRAAIPPGFIRLARAPADDPLIQEVWI